MGRRRDYLKPQNKPQKKCRCGESMIYTGSYAHHNPKIDGVDVCENCYVKYLTERFWAKRQAEKEGDSD